MSWKGTMWVKSHMYLRIQHDKMDCLKLSTVVLDLGVNSFHHTVLFKTLMIFIVVLDLELNSFHHTILWRHWWFSIFSSPFCLECVDMVERNNHWTLLTWQHTLSLFLILFCNVLLDWSWVRQVYLRFHLTSSFCKCLIIPFFNKFIVVVTY